MAHPDPHCLMQDYGTNQAYVFYGHHDEKFRDVDVEELPESAHVIAELPPQPQSMSLMDVQIWVIKLFRLHPETQDLQIKGFYSDYCPSVLIRGWDDGYWTTYDYLCDKSWASFAKKVRGRKNGMDMFVLYVDCSEIKHYGSLLKAIPGDYSQLETAVLPDQKSMSKFFFPLNCDEMKIKLQKAETHEVTGMNNEDKNVLFEEEAECLRFSQRTNK
uniref:Uncharacterized protein n=1 Tax=Leersia perrieri TaxID=77586 RepID=A0A0D9X276_9ORYZ